MNNFYSPLRNILKASIVFLSAICLSTIGNSQNVTINCQSCGTNDVAAAISAIAANSGVLNNLTIDETTGAITDLSGLVGLTQLTGNLSIRKLGTIGGVGISEDDLEGLSNLSIVEGGITIGGSIANANISLTTISLPSLIRTVNGTLSISHNSNAIVLSLPLFVEVGGTNRDLVVGGGPGGAMPNLTMLDLSSLEKVSRNLDLSYLGVTNISLPKIDSVGNNMTIEENSNLVNIQITNPFEVKNSLVVRNNGLTGLDQVNLDGLISVGQDLLLTNSIDHNSQATVSLSNLMSVGRDISFNRIAKENLSLPQLTGVVRDFDIRNNESLVSLQVPNLLKTSRNLELRSNPVIESVLFTVLDTVQNTMFFADQEKVTSFDACFPSLVFVGANLNINNNDFLDQCCIVVCQITVIGTKTIAGNLIGGNCRNEAAIMASCDGKFQISVQLNTLVTPGSLSCGYPSITLDNNTTDATYDNIGCIDVCDQVNNFRISGGGGSSGFGIISNAIGSTLSLYNKYVISYSMSGAGVINPGRGSDNLNDVFGIGNTSVVTSNPDFLFGPSGIRTIRLAANETQMGTITFTIYSFVDKNEDGIEDTDECSSQANPVIININVHPEPIVIVTYNDIPPGQNPNPAHPNTRYICSGETTNFTLSTVFTGTEGVDYQFELVSLRYDDGSDGNVNAGNDGPGYGSVTGGSLTTGVITSGTISETLENNTDAPIRIIYRFRIVALNGLLCVGPDQSVNVVVANLPSFIDTALVNCELMEGTDISMFDLTPLTNLFINGSSGISVSWYNNEQLTSEILNPDSYLTNSTVVYGKVTIDSTGCYSVAPVILNVNPKPIAYDRTLSACEDVFGGNEATFDLTDIEIGVTGEASNVEVSWYEDEALTSVIPNPNGYLSQSKVIFALITDTETTCTNIAEVTLEVLPKPEITCPNDQQLCYVEGSVDLTTLSPAAEPLGGIFTGDGVTDNIFDPSAYVDSKVMITYTYEDINGCENSCLFSFMVNQTPSSPEADVIFDEGCFGDAMEERARIRVLLPGSADDYEAVWIIGNNPEGIAIGTEFTPGMNVPGILTFPTTNRRTARIESNAPVGVYEFCVKIVDRNTGCESTEACDYSIVVHPLPILEAQDIEICAYQNPFDLTSLESEITTETGTFVYEFEGLEISNPEAFGAEDGDIVNVTFVNSNNCSSNTTITFSVLSAPSINILPFDTNPFNEVCVGDEARFLASPPAEGNAIFPAVMSYNWMFSGTPTLEDYGQIATDGTRRNRGASYSSSDTGPQTVDLTVTYINGCTVEAPQHIINVNPTPNTSISLPEFLCIDTTILVTSTTLEGTPPFTDHTWTQVGTGSVEIENNNETANIKGLTSGDVTIQYEVTDANGCSATESSTITVFDCSQYSISNNRTPEDPCSCNNDQTNNGSQDGTFNETVSISPTTSAETWTVVGIRALDPLGTLPSGVAVGDVLDFNITMDRHEVSFVHTDLSGYEIIVEGPNSSVGVPGTPNSGNIQLITSNLCQYPVVAFDPSVSSSYCASDPLVDLGLQELNGFSGSSSFFINANPGTQIVPSTLSNGNNNVLGIFEGDFVNNVGGTIDAPAFPGCRTEIFQEFLINPNPELPIADPIADQGCFGDIREERARIRVVLPGSSDDFEAVWIIGNNPAGITPGTEFSPGMNVPGILTFPIINRRTARIESNAPVGVYEFCVKIVDINSGCESEQACGYSITVHALPIINAQSVEICENENPFDLTSLESAITLETGSFVYLLDGVTVTNPSSFTALDGDIVTVTFTDENGCSSETTITFSVYPLPETPVIEGQILACPSEQYVQYNITNFDPSFNYEWEISGPASIIGSNTGASIFVNFENEPGGLVSLSVTATSGLPRCATSSTLDIVIERLLPLACNFDINLTVDGECNLEITPSMLLEGEVYDESSYTVVVKNQYGEVIPQPLPKSVIGQRLQVSIIQRCFPQQSCHGHVTIEDKIAPIVECNCAEEDECTFRCIDLEVVQSETLDMLLGRPGASRAVLTTPPTYSDACSDVTVTFNNRIVKDKCGTSILYRDWIFTDASGNRSFCTQVFYFNPITISELSRPQQNVHLGCGALTSPEDVASSFDVDSRPGICNVNNIGDFCDDWSASTHVVELHEGYPYAYYTYEVIGFDGNLHKMKVDNNVCEIFAGYTDQEYEVCEEAGCPGSKKVFRSWTVLDWCTGETDKFLQVIKAVDEEGPTYNVTDAIDSTDPWLCSATWIVPAPQDLRDNCAPLSKITWGVIAPAPAVVSGRFPNYSVSNLSKGQNIITYWAEDCCGNRTEKEIVVTVNDITAPVAIVKQNIVLGLTGSVNGPNGYAKLYGWQVDNGSFDVCSDSVKIEIRRLSGGDCDNSGSNNHNNNSTYNNNSGLTNATAGSSWIHTNDNVLDTDDGAFVKFCCEDIPAGQEFANHDVEIRVWDDANMNGIYGDNLIINGVRDNYNTTWATIRVENKLPPVLTCPANVNVFCDEEIYLSLDQDTRVADVNLNRTGYPQVTDLCTNILLTYSDQWVGQYNESCKLGTIRRTFKATKGSVVSTCTQLININSLPSTFNVTFPQNNGTTVWNKCSLTATDAKSSSNPLIKKPIVTEGSCDQVGESIKIDTFLFSDGVCKKWRVEYNYLNWCTNEKIGPFVHFYTYRDNVAPTISCNDIMFEANKNASNTKCEASVRLEASATDATTCNEIGGIRWQVFADIWSDGTVDRLGSSFVNQAWNNTWVAISKTVNGQINPNWTSLQNQHPQILLADLVYVTYLAPTTANGTVVRTPAFTVEVSQITHKVFWTATDGCGNVDNCQNTLMVVDKKKPTPYCVDISTALMEGTPRMVELWARDFDRGSFDNCTQSSNLYFTFDNVAPRQSRIGQIHWYKLNSNGNVVDATEQEYLAGDAYKWIPATKSAGKVFTQVGDFNVIMTVWDEFGNNEYCTIQLNVRGPSFRLLSGQIKNEQGLPVKNVEVTIDMNEVEFPKTLVTNENGSYEIEVPADEDYHVSAALDRDHMNGVSTLDLVLIQRHILQITPLNSMYKLIAADANNDGKITASDLSEIRKLILGIALEFSKNQSWRFAWMGSDITDKPIRFIEKGDSQDGINDFMAIKIGDVNGNASTDMGQGKVESRTNKVLKLSAPDIDFKAANIYPIAVTADNYDMISGFQFTMALEGLELINILPGALPIDVDNFATFKDGRATISYAAEIEESFDSNEVLFTLLVKCNKNVNISNGLKINSEITRSEAYFEDLKVGDVLLRTTGKEIDDVILYQNEPNPFVSATDIRFYLPEAQNIVLTIHDVLGNTVYSTSFEGQKGFNTHMIEKSKLVNPTGIMYYTLNVKNFSDTKKMILIE